MKMPLLTIFRAVIDTDMQPNEVAARIRNYTCEDEPNEWGICRVGDNRWVGKVERDRFRLRKPYNLEVGQWGQDWAFAKLFGTIRGHGSGCQVEVAAVARSTVVLTNLAVILGIVAIGWIASPYFDVINLAMFLICFHAIALTILYGFNRRWSEREFAFLRDLLDGRQVQPREANLKPGRLC